jgi:bacteriocin biosynthesis cyclodehydratase domain-containing protein
MHTCVLFVEGRFGQSVAAALAEYLPAVRTLSLADSVGDFDAHIRAATFVGVALWRPYVPECDALDAACWRQGIPWSSAVLDRTMLITGPVITPGASPCFACYHRRRLSHVRTPERERVLLEAYAQDTACGLPGFLPGIVTMAVAALLLDQRDYQSASGRLCLADMLTGHVDETRVVRVHGCHRCSRSARTGTRFVDHLMPVVKELLS